MVPCMITCGEHGYQSCMNEIAWNCVDRMIPCMELQEKSVDSKKVVEKCGMHTSGNHLNFFLIR